MLFSFTKSKTELATMLKVFIALVLPSKDLPVTSSPSSKSSNSMLNNSLVYIFLASSCFFNSNSASKSSDILSNGISFNANCVSPTSNSPSKVT